MTQQNNFFKPLMLARSVLIFDQCKTNVIIAILAEANARRNRHFGSINEQFRKFNDPIAANCAEFSPTQTSLLLGESPLNPSHSIHHTIHHAGVCTFL